MLSELKVFVSRGNTYEARIGQTDDLVMALILVVRMLEYISSWDESSQAAISSNFVTDEDASYSAPMPSIFI